MGTSSLPKVHRYSLQFKATAVRLSELPDILIKDVADALDIHPFMCMNRPGKVTDNAFMESFFHSMKADVIHGCVFKEDSQMLFVLRSYIPFYNRSRMHSSLNYMSPAMYENKLA